VCEYYDLDCPEQIVHGTRPINAVLFNRKGNGEDDEYYGRRFDNLNDMVKILDKYSHVLQYRVFEPYFDTSVKKQVCRQMKSRFYFICFVCLFVCLFVLLLLLLLLLLCSKAEYCVCAGRSIVPSCSHDHSARGWSHQRIISSRARCCD
jgi:hypothetical protein